MFACEQFNFEHLYAIPCLFAGSAKEEPGDLQTGKRGESVQCKAKTIGHEIRRIERLLAVNVSRRLSAYARENGIDRITFNHSWVMRYLYENQGREVCQRDIEKAFSIGRSTMTEMLNTLEKREYLHRELVEHDARLKRVALTGKGMDVVQKIEQFFEAFETELSDGITQEESEVFYRVMDKVGENLKRPEMPDVAAHGQECPFAGHSLKK